MAFSGQNGQPPTRIENVYSMAPVDPNMFNQRKSMIRVKPDYKLKGLDDSTIEKAVHFDEGTVAIRARYGSFRASGSLRDHRPGEHDGPRSVYSGVGGVPSIEFGLNETRDNFIDRLVREGFSTSMAEDLWNDIVLSRLEIVGPSPTSITAPSMGNRFEQFTIAGIVGIPCVTAVTSGDQVEFVLPTEAQTRALVSVPPTQRTEKWNPARIQLTVRPVTAKNHVGSFLNRLAHFTEAPTHSREVLSFLSRAFATEAVPHIMFQQAEMEKFLAMLSAFMTSLGLVFVSEQAGDAQSRADVDFAASIFAPTGNAPKKWDAARNKADFSDLSRFLFVNANNNTEAPNDGDNCVAIPSAIGQVAVIAQMLSSNSGDMDTTSSASSIKTAGFLDTATDDEKRRMVDLRVKLFRSLMEGSFAGVRKVEEDPRANRVDFQHVFGTVTDNDGINSANPFVEPDTLSFKNDKIGRIAAKVSTSAADSVKSVVGFLLEQERRRAGTALNSCGPGGIVTINYRA